MRTGSNPSHQTLTPEAASVLKQSLTMAKRRGHSQITPLHVAFTLLTSSRQNLFGRACLKSQPFHGINRQITHPSLHCRALELCFNVALNRLPTNPNPLFQSQPSLSNALIAALKRAQAHQRKGCVVEHQNQQQQQQQQPFLAVKIELEQLVVSILDDPSVSRVMREAGFSSTVVKNNVEDDCSVVSPVFHGSSVGVFSSPCSPSYSASRDQTGINPRNFWQTQMINPTFDPNPGFRFHQKRNFNTDSAFSDVIEVLLSKNKKKNTVLVGDSLSATEGIVEELMNKIERGDVSDDLKQTNFIKFQFSSGEIKLMKRDEIETHLNQLKRKVCSFRSSGKCVIVYLGDLNWVVGDDNDGGFSSVDYLVEEIGNLVSEYGRNGNNMMAERRRVWVLGTASFQTYMKCQMRQPRLDVQWGFQAVSVPSGGLGLTLHASRTHESKIKISQNPSQIMDIKPFSSRYEEEDELSCCRECVCNFKKEAQELNFAQQMRLHPWLQLEGHNAKQKDELVDLKRKWNRFCQTLHQEKATNNTHNLFGKSCSYPSSPFNWWTVQTNTPTTSPDSISFADSNPNLNRRTPSPVAKFRRQNSSTIEFKFDDQSHMVKLASDHNLNCFSENEDEDTKIGLALGRSPLTSDSEKSGETIHDRRVKMKNLIKNLNENLPWQREIVPLIAGVIDDSANCRNSDVWMLIGGNDLNGKRRLARAIADSLFGSMDCFLQIKKGKLRDAEICSEILTRTLREKENLVVLVEGIDSVNIGFAKFLSQGFQTREFGELNRKNVRNGQVIFILTRDDDCLNDEDETTNQDFVVGMALKVEKTGCSDHKRKCTFETLNGLKKLRTDEKEEESTVSCDSSNMKKDFPRQMRIADSLDLNLTANEDNEEENNPEETGLGFLSLIQKRFSFNRDQTEEQKMKEGYLIKIKNAFDEILGEQETVRLIVDENATKKLCTASGLFLKGTFEKWLKEVFQKCLVTVKNGGNDDGIGVIKLCIEGIHEKVNKEDGFMGTCLPKEIQVFI